MTLKNRNSIKNLYHVPKKETPSIYGTRWVFDQKRKSCPHEVGMNRLKSYKSGNMLIWKIILQKLFSATATPFLQRPTYPTASGISHQYQSTIKNPCPAFVEAEYNFNWHEETTNYKKTQDSLSDPKKFKIFSFFLRPKLDPISICGHGFKHIVYFDDIVHFLDKEKDEDFWKLWLWFYFLAWGSYKSRTYQPRAEKLFQLLWKSQVHSK